MPPTTPTKLTRRHEKALAALLTTPSYAAAAAASSVPERTIRYWVRNVPEFVKEYRARRRELYDAALGQAEQLLHSAVATLARNLSGPPAAGNRAALGLLDIVVKGREHTELIERIEELERLVEQQARTKAKGAKP